MSSTAPAIAHADPLPHLQREVFAYSDWPRIRETWCALFVKSPYRSAFLSCAWIDSWLSVFGEELRPQFVFFRAGEQVVAACVFVPVDGWRGPFRVRRVFLNATGEPESDDLCVEYNNLLVLEGWERAAAESVAEYLKQIHWNEVVATGFRPGPPLECLREALRGITEQSDVKPTNYVDLDQLRASGVKYEDAIPRGMRKQVRHNRKIYQERGPLRLSVASTAEEAGVFLEELIALHQKSWVARGEPGVFASARFTAFHRSFVRDGSGTGSVLLARLAAGEQTVGVIYGLVLDRKVCFYQSGLAYEEDYRIKPGFVALSELIQYCLDAGYAEFDFLAGDAQYKKLLSTHVRSMEWSVFQRPSLKFTALRLMRSARRKVRAQVSAATESPAVETDEFRTTLIPYTDWPTLRSTWKQLFAQSPYSSAFLSPEWVESWLEAFGAVLKPVMVRFDAGVTPVGVCLLVFRPYRIGPFRLTRVHLNTAGEDQAEACTLEYNSILCLKGHEERVAAAVRRTLDLHGWDEFRVPGIVPGPVSRALSSAFRDVSLLAETRPAYYLNLSDLRERGVSYEEVLGRKPRQQIRHSIRLYGEVQLEVASTLEQAIEMFEEMVALHQQAWQLRGEPGAFASPRFVDFHRRFIERAFARGSVQLLRLRNNGSTIGVRYNFVHKGSVFCYQAGLQYTPDRHRKPGYVLHSYAIQHCIDNGFVAYDMMAGGAHYKEHLTNSSRDLEWIVYRRKTLTIWTIDLLRKVKRALARTAAPHAVLGIE